MLLQHRYACSCDCIPFPVSARCAAGPHSNLHHCLLQPGVSVFISTLHCRLSQHNTTIRPVHHTKCVQFPPVPPEDPNVPEVPELPGAPELPRPGPTPVPMCFLPADSELAARADIRNYLMALTGQITIAAAAAVELPCTYQAGVPAGSHGGSLCRGNTKSWGLGVQLP